MFNQHPNKEQFQPQEVSAKGDDIIFENDEQSIIVVANISYCDHCCPCRKSE